MRVHAAGRVCNVLYKKNAGNSHIEACKKRSNSPITRHLHECVRNSFLGRQKYQNNHPSKTCIRILLITVMVIIAIFIRSALSVSTNAGTSQKRSLAIQEVKTHTHTVGASIIRIGFGGILYYN